MDALSTTTHRFIDIAILVPVPPNLINRDDMGKPKTTVFGGVPRLGPSPQNFKIGLRRGSKSGQCLIRTKWLPGLILAQVFGETKVATECSQQELVLYEALCNALYNNDKKDEAAAKKAADALVQATKKALKDGKEPPKEKAQAVVDNREMAGLVLVTQEEIDFLVELVKPILTNTSLDKKELKAALTLAVQQAFAKARRTDQSLIRSLFGRMVTNSPMDGHPDGALQMGWPFSVERAHIQSDYFIAVDDRKTSFIEESGGGHIGDRQNAGGHTMFLQIQIDLNLLVQNARFSSLTQAMQTHETVIKDILKDIIETIVFRPFANAAAQGSFRTSPRACMAVVRTSKTGCLYDLAPAFETPIRSDGDRPVRTIAGEKLLSYLNRHNEAFGDPLDTVVFSADQDGRQITFMDAVMDVISKVLA